MKILYAGISEKPLIKNNKWFSTLKTKLSGLQTDFPQDTADFHCRNLQDLEVCTK